MMLLHEMFQRDDGRFQISLGDDAGSFETRAFALAISGYSSPATAPITKFRRIKISEVRSNASA
jgi:hypothetical protein